MLKAMTLIVSPNPSVTRLETRRFMRMVTSARPAPTTPPTTIATTTAGANGQ